MEAPTEGCRETFLESFVESPALDVPWTLVVLLCRHGGVGCLVEVVWPVTGQRAPGPGRLGKAEGVSVSLN